ncbi:MAG: hypothetical protein KJO07_02990 [Deltaproteobacteria bacterium]|nr:hypothetical protein [Deltaproteobacteria bacterium]
MFFWFAGLAFVGVVLVFDSAALDYRLIMVGSVLPLLEAPFGPNVLHTLAFAVVLLAAVMLVFRGQRLRQRRWLALPIGVMAHLVLDATWATKELFWWPAFGFSFSGFDVPELARNPALLVLMEVAGLAALAWAARRYRLTEAATRADFLRTGRLDRALV